MSRVGFGKKIAAAALAFVAIGAAASSTKAATITFATFGDTRANLWSYSNSSGVMSGSGVTTTLSDLGAGIISYGGAATYDVTITRTAAVTGTGPFSQAITGSMVFRDLASAKIFDITFSGQILSGNGSAGGIQGDDQIIGQTISYDSLGGPYPHVIGSFVGPFSFSISLTTNHNLAVGSGGNFTDFLATGSGNFSADSLGAGNPAPLPAAAWGGLSMMGALGLGAAARRRK